MRPRAPAKVGARLRLARSQPAAAQGGVQQAAHGRLQHIKHVQCPLLRLARQGTARELRLSAAHHSLEAFRGGHGLCQACCGGAPDTRVGVARALRSPQQAAAEGRSLAKLIAEVDRHRTGNLSSALRVHAAVWLRDRATYG